MVHLPADLYLDGQATTVVDLNDHLSALTYTDLATFLLHPTTISSEQVDYTGTTRTLPLAPRLRHGPPHDATLNVSTSHLRDWLLTTHPTRLGPLNAVLARDRINGTNLPGRVQLDSTNWYAKLIRNHQGVPFRIRIARITPTSTTHFSTTLDDHIDLDELAHLCRTPAGYELLNDLYITNRAGPPQPMSALIATLRDALT